MEWKLQFSGQFRLKILCMLFKKVCGSLYQDHLTDLLPPGNIQRSHSFRLNILSACIQIFLEIKLLHKILILLHQYFCLLLLINGNKRLVDHIIKFWRIHRLQHIAQHSVLDRQSGIFKITVSAENNDGHLRIKLTHFLHQLQSGHKWHLYIT